MNENINLCELLKDHVEETFYSSAYGDVTLYDIIPNNPYPIVIQIPDGECFFLRSLTKDGKLYEKRNVECILFPSEYRRDWNKWAEEQKPKVPAKTWSELVKQESGDIILGCHTCSLDYHVCSANGDDCSETLKNTPIEKSALAMMKIYQLIEVGYGGNITNEEWIDESIIKFTLNARNNKVVPSNTFRYKELIAFHTEAQRDEFLSYPENVQLVHEFYQIS